MAHRFRKIGEVELPEYRSIGVHYEHPATGFEVFHLVNDDVENLFAFAFRTLPFDSSGAPHIVEHCVLCGSERYPLKDAFSSMSFASLNTFMNAFTSPDKTVYPASSAVASDYFNLLSAYADLVFFPQLRPEAFRQEGFRLAMDESGKLSFQGVVYSEMRGSYADPEALLDDRAIRSLFSPGHPYSFDSGGDPSCIPQLSYQDFLDFHRRYYHPANCRLFLYGDIDGQRQLDFLEERVLSRFSKGSFAGAVPLEKAFTQSHYELIPYPSEETEPKTTVLLSFATLDLADPLSSLSMEVLAEILLGHEGSPLIRALRESGLGEDIAPQSGIGLDTRQIIFASGLRGVRAADENRVEAFILDFLAQLARQGIRPQDIEAALRSVEFNNRELKRSSGPYSLRLMRRCLRGWLNGLSPESNLLFGPSMAQLRQAMAQDPRYFESLIQGQLVENSHRVCLTLKGEPGLAAIQERAEADRLAQAYAQLGPNAQEILAKEAEDLSAFQAMPDDPNCLPQVGRRELESKIRKIERAELRISTTPLLAQPGFTNGISYLNLAFDMSQLDPGLFPYLPLFSRVLPSSGLPGLPYHEVNSLLARCSGGFACLLESSSALADKPWEESRLHAIFKLKSLDSSLAEALDLAGRLLLGADLMDGERLLSVYREMRNDLASSVIPHGQAFAQLRSASAFSLSTRIEDTYSGFSQLEFLAKLGDSPDPGHLASKLESIRSSLIDGSSLKIGLCCEEGFREEAQALISQLVAGLPRGPTRSYAPLRDAVRPTGDEAYCIASQVGYASMSLKAARIGQDNLAAQLVLAGLLSQEYLWEKIRMKQGAYGVWAALDPMEGLLSFVSYRDPEPLSSQATFMDGLEFYAGGHAKEDSIEKGVVKLLAQEQRPLSPEERGLIDFRRWLYGIDDRVRQERRDQLMAVGPAEVQKAAIDLLDAAGHSVHTIVAGEAETGRAQKLPRPYALQKPAL